MHLSYHPISIPFHLGQMSLLNPLRNIAPAGYHPLDQHGHDDEADVSELEERYQLDERDKEDEANEENEPSDRYQRGHLTPATEFSGSGRRLHSVVVGLVLGGILVLDLLWLRRANSTRTTSVQHKNSTAARYWPNQDWNYMADDVYTHFSPTDQDDRKGDRACGKWIPGSSKDAAECWRAKRYDQLDDFLSSNLTRLLSWGG